jgi:RimJ/RimL family protein N-acetyltransferase
METALLAPTFLAPETIRKLRLTLVGNFTPMIYSTFLMKSVDAMMHEDPELIDQFSRQHEWDNHDDDEWDDKDSTATQLSLEQQRMQKIIGEYGIFNLDTPKGLKKDPLKDDGILDTDAVRNLLKDLG